VELYLRKRGLLDEESEIPEDLQSIEAASRASVAQKITYGERRGQRVRRVGFRRDGDVMEFKGPTAIQNEAHTIDKGLYERSFLSQLTHRRVNTLDGQRKLNFRNR